MTRTSDIAAEIGFSISPYQVVNEFSVNWESDLAPKSIKVFNALGQCISVIQKPIGKSCSLNAAEWPAGIYFVQADFEGNLIGGKFVVN